MPDDHTSSLQVISDLTPKNARIVWLSRELASECQSIESWYGTAYSNHPVPEEWMKLWEYDPCATANGENGSEAVGFLLSSAPLRLPDLNEFIPSDLTLIEVRTFYIFFFFHHRV